MRSLKALSFAALIGPGVVSAFAASVGPGAATVASSRAAIADARGLAAHAPGQIIVGLRDGAKVDGALRAVRLGAATARHCVDRTGAIARLRTSGSFPRDPDGRFRVAGHAYDDLAHVPADLLFGEAYATMGDHEQRLYRSYVVSLPAGTDLPAALDRLRAHADVEYAEPNYLATTSLVPNDPLYGQQWAHQRTGAELGWDTETGDPAVRIAIVDSGVAYTHPDLAPNIWHDGAGHPGRDFVDVDTAAYVAAGYTLVPGEDYTDLDDDPSDALGHGTHVAGIAAAGGDRHERDRRSARRARHDGVAARSLVLPAAERPRRDRRRRRRLKEKTARSRPSPGTSTRTAAPTSS